MSTVKPTVKSLAFFGGIQKRAPGHSKAAPLRKHLYGFGSSGARIGQNEGVV